MKTIIPNLLFTTYILGVFMLVTACNSQLDIQQHYPFTVTAMPVQKSISKGETAEIRVKINREGYFDEAAYYIRYFQPDGEGELRLADGTVLLPNDLYQLSEDTFRLYYTSQTTEQQKIDIYIEDDFEHIEQLSFSFNNRMVKDD